MNKGTERYLDLIEPYWNVKHIESLLFIFF